MEPSVRLDKKGMTLIEVLIALLLLAVTSLAMIQSALVAMNANITNELRDEAVSVAEQRLNELRNTPFANLDTLPPETVITRNIRATVRSFTPTRTIVTVNDFCKQITLTVSLDYKGSTYQHGVSTVVRSQ